MGIKKSDSCNPSSAVREAPPFVHKSLSTPCAMMRPLLHFLRCASILSCDRNRVVECQTDEELRRTSHRLCCRIASELHRTASAMSYDTSLQELSARYQELRIRFQDLSSRYQKHLESRPILFDHDSSGRRTTRFTSDSVSSLLNALQQWLPQEMKDMVLAHLEPFAFAIVRHALCPSRIVYAGQHCKLLRVSKLAECHSRSNDKARTAYYKTLAAWKTVSSYVFKHRLLDRLPYDLYDLQFSPDCSTCFTLGSSSRCLTLRSLTTKRMRKTCYWYHVLGAKYVGAASLCIKLRGPILEYWSLSDRPKRLGIYRTESLIQEMAISTKYILDTGYGMQAAMWRHNDLNDRQWIDLPECLKETMRASFSSDESIGIFAVGAEMFMAKLGDNIDPIRLLRNRNDMIGYTGFSPNGEWIYAIDYHGQAIEIWHIKHLESPPMVFDHDSSGCRTTRFTSPSVSADSKYLFVGAQWRFLILKVNDDSVEEIYNRPCASSSVLSSFLDGFLFIDHDKCIDLAKVRGLESEIEIYTGLEALEETPISPTGEGICNY